MMVVLSATTVGPAFVEVWRPRRVKALVRDLKGPLLSRLLDLSLGISVTGRDFERCSSSISGLGKSGHVYPAGVMGVTGICDGG